MNNQTLKARLDALGYHIDLAQARLKKKDALSDGHARTADELRERYRLLSAKVREEVADAEAHGHHVSDLERSVREWLDGLEMDID